MHGTGIKLPNRERQKTSQKTASPLSTPPKPLPNQPPQPLHHPLLPFLIPPHPFLPLLPSQHLLLLPPTLPLILPLLSQLLHPLELLDRIITTHQIPFVHLLHPLLLVLSEPLQLLSHFPLPLQLPFPRPRVRLWNKLVKLLPVEFPKIFPLVPVVIKRAPPFRLQQLVAVGEVISCWDCWAMATMLLRLILGWERRDVLIVIVVVVVAVVIVGFVGAGVQFWD
ncbi:uncharacterized protein PODANS_4_8940 [Podospora anserina S mat+]|uniref:Podospora anserina S mat+ genomic DNA chromosome 4, supercontig 4 n=1 Tax=Podospora anserina (strain S / ATCC MYA-4624 / DSM 980 / FGSC 10383) TaxID=515849 RepID=B2AR18_PODAN|nr:uncharacterized protein PODANS_4_8940 [Podospora anserina S mat+]CAP66596.1 unnamed protein product [Podospora anserina S mat+]